MNSKDLSVDFIDDELLEESVEDVTSPALSSSNVSIDDLEEELVELDTIEVSATIKYVEGGKGMSDGENKPIGHAFSFVLVLVLAGFFITLIAIFIRKRGKPYEQ